MARKKSREGKTSATKKPRYCSMPQPAERALPSNISSGRLRLIRVNESKWVNGTQLHYYFFRSPAKWASTDAEKKKVRQAFKVWKDVGIGLEFKEVTSPDEAEIRIGFERNDGHWSFLGRGVLRHGPDKRTMNIDKGDNWPVDTAVHEIGHTLGFPHEHQNPNAGIVWNEEAVYTTLAGAPNFWSRDDTYHNIIRKIQPDSVQGSSWDSNSIMHYRFEPGLIDKPERYRNGLVPAPDLSTRDKQWVKEFYPALGTRDYKKLTPFQSVRLRLDPGEQANFTVHPEGTRKYTISTFGPSDTILVLFEDVNGELRYQTADDDSGQDFNSKITVRLFKDRKYIVRLRLYYQDSAGDAGIMMW